MQMHMLSFLYLWFCGYSGLVNKAIGTNSEQFQTFLRGIFATQKTQNQQKPTNKLKLSEY